MYCVATPTYASSTTLPSSLLAVVGSIRIFSGRIPTARRRPRHRPIAAGRAEAFAWYEAQRENLAENLQCGRAHGIAGELDEIGGGRIAADPEDLLTKCIEQRLASIDVMRVAGCDDEQLAGLGGIRISKHR